LREIFAVWNMIFRGAFWTRWRFSKMTRIGDANLRELKSAGGGSESETTGSDMTSREKMWCCIEFATGAWSMGGEKAEAP